MLKVLDKIKVGNLYCVSVEGDIWLLKNGLKLTDEKRQKYIIETIGMVHYCKTENIKEHAELVLNGDIENIGVTLKIE